MAVVYCVCISYIVYRTQVYPIVALAYRYTHSTNHIPPCPAMLRHRQAPPCCCIPLSIGIYRMFSPAPLHTPLRRSYFDSNGLLLLGYKYPASIVKTLYSLILAVWWLLLDVRLFWCCYRYAVYRVPHGVGWGIYYILRGAGYSLYHTPHIKRGWNLAACLCSPPLGASLLTSGANCVSIILVLFTIVNLRYCSAFLRQGE